ncbi:polysaccharide deacetylase family protein [Streptococcus catagoni]|uniref:polysaccharide deacetylase family protein n=1 Tax=Streptococcus catagoni TaxID=2654874 RepID=UPI001F44267A|nr:polysaccharide deacetylase family protein [Streptococcus catagoni]
MVEKQSEFMMKKRKKLTLINSILIFLCIVCCLSILFLYMNQSQKTGFAIFDKINKTVTQKNQKKQKVVLKESKPQSKTGKEVQWIKKDQPVKLPILMYHAVHKMAPEEAANANLIVDPTLFEQQIKALKEAGYYFLSPEEAYRLLSSNEVPAEKSVWLTFDDSMIDFYKIAFPILKKYQAKATNNVITGLTENHSTANLSVDQMKEMKKFGMSFQDHTVNHPDLSQSDPEAQLREMKDSMLYLNQELNQETIAIAYPSGRYSDTTLSIAKDLHYKLGLTTNEGLASAADGLLSLNRVRILPSTSAETLLSQIATN